jgi:hypothetical protein
VARRFVDLVERQLDLFAAEQAGLIADVEAALGAYDRAPRGEAEERYGDFLDLVETGTDELIDLRENYAVSLDGVAAEEYRGAFNDVVRRRLPRFGLELD